MSWDVHRQVTASAADPQAVQSALPSARRCNVGRSDQLSSGKWPILAHYCTGRRVLDIGCIGDYTAIEELADSQFARLAAISDATGVDINTAGVDYLCSMGLDCRVLNAVDIETLDSESFDIVFVGDLIEHLPNPGDFLKKLRQLVKPRTGLVLIATNNALHWLNPVGMMPPRTREQRCSWDSRGQHTMWFCSVTLRNLMRFAGYRQQSMFFVTSWHVFAASDWWHLQRKCRLAIERVLFRVNPELADAIFGVYQPVDEFDDETERRIHEERWHENAIKREEAKAADQDGPSSGICVVDD